MNKQTTTTIKPMAPDRLLLLFLSSIVAVPEVVRVDNLTASVSGAAGITGIHHYSS